MCSEVFANKQKFGDHIPCFYSCSCSKKFSNFYTFSLHQSKCIEELKSLYHNVISYECVICGMDGMLADDMRVHIEGLHVTCSRCESCSVDVSNMIDHIFDHHYRIRRMKKSYTKFKLDVNRVEDDAPSMENQPRQISPSHSVASLAVAFKSKPLESISSSTPKSGLIFAVKSKPQWVREEPDIDDSLLVCPTVSSTWNIDKEGEEYDDYNRLVRQTYHFYLIQTFLID